MAKAFDRFGPVKGRGQRTRQVESESCVASPDVASKVLAGMDGEPVANGAVNDGVGRVGELSEKDGQRRESLEEDGPFDVHVFVDVQAIVENVDVDRLSRGEADFENGSAKVYSLLNLRVQKAIGEDLVQRAWKVDIGWTFVLFEEIAELLDEEQIAT